MSNEQRLACDLHVVRQYALNPYFSNMSSSIFAWQKKEKTLSTATEALILGKSEWCFTYLYGGKVEQRLREEELVVLGLDLHRSK